MYGSNPYILASVYGLKIFIHILYETINIQYQNIFFILRIHCCKSCPLHGFSIFLNCTTYEHVYIFSTIMYEFYKETLYKHDNIDMHMRHLEDFNVRIFENLMYGPDISMYGFFSSKF